MNQFFLYWVDLIALLLSVVLGIVLTTTAKRKSLLTIRPFAAFFLFFGPGAIVVHMFFHLTEIFYRAGVAVADGNFVYNFRFYSLQLMGIVLAYLSVQLLGKAFQKCVKAGYKNREIFKIMILVFFVSAPTIPFTPIGSLPVLACIISLVALPFACKKQFKTSKVIVPGNKIAVAEEIKEL